ncbi:hypothetical protein LCGC14_1819220, partial [marine sediment metagenome]
SCEESLKRLRTDYIDLYQIQWPNYEVPIEETIDALLELIKQGKVKEFQSSNPRFNIFLCEYSNNPAFLRKWDIKTGIVKDYRTALFDESHRIAVTPGMLSIPRICDEIKEFVKQMCNAYKLLETHKKTGAREYRYKGANEHYRNALNYFLLAASKNRIIRASDIKTASEKVISNYKRI